MSSVFLTINIIKQTQSFKLKTKVPKIFFFFLNLQISSNSHGKFVKVQHGHVYCYKYKRKLSEGTCCTRYKLMAAQTPLIVFSHRPRDSFNSFKINPLDQEQCSYIEMHRYVSSKTLRKDTIASSWIKHRHTQNKLGHASKQTYWLKLWD